MAKSDSNILKRNKKKQFNIKRPTVLQRKGVKELLILFSLIADFLTVFTLTDKVFTQSLIFSVITSVTLVSVLDTTPDILAGVINNKEMDQKQKKIYIVALLVLFFAFYFTVAGLAFSCRELLFVDTSNVVQSTSAYVATPAQNMCAFMLAFIPLGTSGVVFAISIQENKENDLKEECELQNIDLQAQSDSYQIMIDEIKEELEFSLEEYDARQKEIIIQLLKDEAKQLEVLSRDMLSKEHPSPETVSYLQEKGYLATQE